MILPAVREGCAFQLQRDYNFDMHSHRTGSGRSILGRASRFALVVLLTSAVTGASADIDEPYPVDWQGVPLADALRELADRYELLCVLDGAVPDEAAHVRVRMFASHLTARQALRYLARWADLESVFHDDTVLLAPPERLPRTWRHQADRDAAPSADRQAEVLFARSGKVDWIDAPLSLVARDVSATFGVDVIFHRALIAAQKIVHLPETTATLREICGNLSEQLEATHAYRDGAIWVYPPSAEPRTRPAQPATIPAPESLFTGVEVLRALSLRIEGPIAGWQDLADRMAEQTGLSCRVEPQTPDPAPRFEASGTALEVLEAAALLGLFTYRVEETGPDAPAEMILHPGGAP